MAIYDGLPIRYQSNGFILAAVFLLTGCSLAYEQPATNTPIVSPFTGAPVTVTLDGQTLTVANHTSDAIYQLAFPSEILPVIEWAPCLAPEVCPAEQRIDSGAEKRIELRSIAAEGTDEITVFWWRYLEKMPGAGIPPMELEEIKIGLP